MMAMASTAEDPRGAGTVGDAANLLRITNRRTEAEPLLRRALAITEKSYGPDHPDVAERLNNLAWLLETTNRLGEAEPLFRRALAITEKSYGSDHPSVPGSRRRTSIVAFNRSEEHTSELQSHLNLVCRLLLEK